MITIREIDKKDKDEYFVIYELNKKVFTFNGNSKDVLNDLFETNKKINDK